MQLRALHMTRINVYIPCQSRIDSLILFLTFSLCFDKNRCLAFGAIIDSLILVMARWLQ